MNHMYAVTLPTNKTCWWVQSRGVKKQRVSKLVCGKPEAQLQEARLQGDAIVVFGVVQWGVIWCYTVQRNHVWHLVSPGFMKLQVKSV